MKSFLYFLRALCDPPHILSTPLVETSDSWRRKQMLLGVSGLSILVLRFPLFTHQHPAQTGAPPNQTAVSNLGQSVHPLPSSLLPPSRPQPAEAQRWARVTLSCRAGA